MGRVKLLAAASSVGLRIGRFEEKVLRIEIPLAREFTKYLGLGGFSIFLQESREEVEFSITMR